jgi:hypothetical protein
MLRKPGQTGTFAARAKHYYRARCELARIAASGAAVNRSAEERPDQNHLTGEKGAPVRLGAILGTVNAPAAVAAEFLAVAAADFRAVAAELP